MKNRKKHQQNGASILFLLLLLCLLGSCLGEKKELNVALILSQEEERFSAHEILDKLPHAFEDKGYRVDIHPIYLREQCDTSLCNPIVATYLDTVFGGKPDAVLLYGLPALRSYQAYGATSKRQPAVAFSGIYQLNPATLKGHPTIKGHLSKLYYNENLQLINSIYPNAEIDFFFDNSPFRKKAIQEIIHQVDHRRFAFDKAVSDYLCHSDSVAYDSLLILRKKQSAFTHTFITLLPFTELTLSENLNLFESMERKHAYLSIGRMIVDLNLSTVYNGPVFTCCNYEMDPYNGVLGGYFVPIETEVNNWVQTIDDELKHNPIPQLQENQPSYVCNYAVMKSLHLDDSALPQDTVIINKPLMAYYEILFFVVMGITVLLMVVSIWVLLGARKKFQKQQAKQKEEALQSERAMLARLSSNIVSWVYTNGKWQIIQRTEDKINVLQHLNDLSTEDLLRYVHPESQKPLRDLLVKGNRAKNGKQQFKAKRDKNSDYAWYEMIYAISYNEFRLPTVVAFSYSIQQYKEEEEQLENNRKTIEKTDLKQSFLANMTNEILSPTNIIIRNANLLSSPDNVSLTDEERTNYNLELKDNVAKLLKLLDEILQLSHIETGEMQFDVKEYDVSLLITDIYQSYSMIIKPGLQFTMHNDNRLARVLVDKLRFTQLFENLLTNANKFTASGSIELGYTYIENRNEVIIYVKDTGRGVPASKLSHIFELSDTKIDGNDDIGVGLSLSAVIARKMHGHMTAKSKEGEGSTFALVLPCINKME